MSSRHFGCRRIGFVVVAVLAMASSLSAGQLLLQKLEQVAVVDDTPVFLMPDATRVPLRTLPRNSGLEVFSAEGSWLRVRFRDTQYGQRVGYIEARHVQREAPTADVKPGAHEASASESNSQAATSPDGSTTGTQQPTVAPTESSTPAPPASAGESSSGGDRPRAGEPEKAADQEPEQPKSR